VAAIPTALPADLRQQLPRRCMQHLCHTVQDGVVCMSFDVPTTLERDEGPVESFISGAVESAARIS